MSHRFFAAAFAFTAIVLVINAPSRGQGNAKPDIVGTIKTATLTKNAKDVLGSILVEGPKGQTYDKAAIRITTDTKIFKQEGKDRKAASVDDLKVGAKVEAKFVGPVAESYPVQARAGEIVILSDVKE